MMSLLRKLLRRRTAPTFRVGELVHYANRVMAVSRIADGEAELIWLDEQHQLHTAGWVPSSKLRGIDP